MQVADKLSALRAEMTSEGVDAVIVGNSDPHNNELVAERWRCREWLVHMKGSAGTVLVTQDFCGLWTDSRYYEAALMALEGTEVELMRASDVGTPTIDTWLKTHLEEGASVAFNGEEVNETQAREWIRSLTPAGLEIRTELDLIERIWTDRPAAPQGELFLVPEKYTGESTASKIARVREKLAEKKIDAHLLGRTDESCWLFNFRGTDQPGLATPNCYTLITGDSVTFYVDPAKLGPGARKQFEKAGVTLRDYDEVESGLEALHPETRLLLVPRYTSHALYQAGDHCVQITERAPVTDLKGVKNATEIAHTKKALLDDGAAMVRFYHWLYSSLEKGEPVSELSCSRKLETCRAEVEGFRHNGFEAIMGYADHGALNHYSVDEDSDRAIHAESLFLIDSGGSYVHGLTDTTRVIPMGTPSAEQKADYTLVLRSLIELITLRFPEGSTGAQLDGICRQALWLSGRNFKHGTGHGVGFGLEVHEGPQNISGLSKEKMALGQLTTIEPGCYRPGQYGIRIENMVHTVLAHENEFGRFFQFENLTYCPINTDLLEPSLLTPAQLQWLNDYNAEVLEKLTPLLKSEQVSWLTQECRPLKS